MIASCSLTFLKRKVSKRTKCKTAFRLLSAGTADGLSRPVSQWRLSPPFARPPQKSSAFPGTLSFEILRRAKPAFRQEISRSPAKKFAWTRHSARLASAPQEAELDGFQPPSFAMAAFAAICSASFLLCPLPAPTGVPFRSTSTKKRLSWSGPSSPVRRYFSTWPLSRWTSS